MFPGNKSNAVMEKFLSLPQSLDTVMVEYIWIDDTTEPIRSKCKTMNFEPKLPEDCPDLKAYVLGKVGYLTPVAIFKDPFRQQPNKLVLCEVVDEYKTPAQANTRHSCVRVMKMAENEHPLFTIEQKYILLHTDGSTIGRRLPEGTSYCGVGANKVFGRSIAEAHYLACLYAGITIGGFNPHVLPALWEFQVGPCEGVAMGDQLWVARYLLHRVAEDFGMIASFDPSIMDGAKSRVGYSTESMRRTEGSKCVNTSISTTNETSSMVNSSCESPKLKRPRLDLSDSPVGQNSSRSEYNTFTLLTEDDRLPLSNCDPYIVTENIVKKTVQLLS
ncbi:hypothetical protein C0Q70_18413 [Pomacea canaliculata]|uniref:glutamine synthetase n=1 Tax=Pomacea canaliculata TaxID=400727 RepID=A0A2T7NN49_POMCA|nr:glutamine synthetase-like [Pomacea canaliculata]PVD22595.1 hypothetical protein C0Q70_18413 [Pomacea canaliculata]